MPSSPPNAPPPDANTSLKGKPAAGATMSGWAVAGTVIAVIWYFLWNLGAASLSYAKYGSVGWAILDFFFAPFYYPYYALVLNTPAPTMFGGRRRMKLW